MRMMVLALVLMASGCATGSATPVAGPNPALQYFSVTCAGNPSKCYEASARACPFGYDSTSLSGGTTPTLIPIVNGGQTTYVSGTQYDGQMLIACRDTAEPAPAVAQVRARTKELRLRELCDFSRDEHFVSVDCALIQLEPPHDMVDISFFIAARAALSAGKAFLVDAGTPRSTERFISRFELLTVEEAKGRPHTMDAARIVAELGPKMPRD